MQERTTAMHGVWSGRKLLLFPSSYPEHEGSRFLLNVRTYNECSNEIRSRRWYEYGGSQAITGLLAGQRLLVRRQVSSGCSISNGLYSLAHNTP
jgi:hypothetical protein